MPIENLGKGALPDPVDERDFKITAEMLGAVTVDWSKEFRLPAPPDEDQGSSDSCVSQAWSYYHWQLHGKSYSRRDLFARIALDYGAYIRDGGKEIVGNGQATRDEVSDPKPQTFHNMRDKNGIKQEYREDDKELNYFILPQQDINGVAWGIQTYKGVVFGLNGTNAGWQDMLNPRPPFNGESGIWGHALYAMGFHMHGNQKCIIAKSSWCDSVKEHHIKENYFLTGNTFSAWTLIPKGQTMSQVKIAVIHGEGGIFLAAASPEQLKAIGGIFGKDVQVSANGEILNADINV
jgi:hypothetical protein